MSVPTAYQRIGNVGSSPTDYDWQSFPLYLRYNGTNSTMQTAAIDFSSTAAMSVFAGVRKLSDAAIQCLYELSSSFVSNNGVFVALPSWDGGGTAGAYWSASSKGTTGSNAISAASYAAPQTIVQTHQGNIGGDSVTLRANGVQIASSSSDQGTGNFGNHALYLGARGGSSLWFNGRDYGICILGRTPTAAEIANTEAWLNGKTKAYA